jgi:hypothetical protein
VVEEVPIDVAKSVLLLLKKIVPTEAPTILSPFLNWAFVTKAINETGIIRANLFNIMMDFRRLD